MKKFVLAILLSVSTAGAVSDNVAVTLAEREHKTINLQLKSSSGN